MTGRVLFTPDEGWSTSSLSSKRHRGAEDPSSSSSSGSQTSVLQTGRMGMICSRGGSASFPSVSPLNEASYVNRHLSDGYTDRSDSPLQRWTSRGNDTQYFFETNGKTEKLDWKGKQALVPSSDWGWRWRRQKLLMHYMQDMFGLGLFEQSTV